MKKLGQRLAIRYQRTKFNLLSAVSKKKAARAAFDLFCTPQPLPHKPLPKNFIEAQRLELKMGSEKITGYRWNKGGKRKVLIAHGFNSSAASFDSYIRPLLKKDYEILAFDAPAHGKSSGKKVNAAVYKEMIKLVNDQFGPIKSFLGHSFGGLGLALALEDMPHDESYRLVLIAPATETTTAINYFFDFLKLNGSFRKEFDDFIFSIHQKPSTWYSISRAIQNIHAKVRWFHDEDDDVTPWPDAKKVMAKNYANVDFVITRGLGHRRIYRDQMVSKSAVDFL